MIAALGACITVSCNKEFEDPEVTAGQQGEAAPADELEEGSAVVFSAGFQDMSETKTVIGAKENEGDYYYYYPKWTTGEKIRINSVESSGTTLINGGEHANFTVEGVSAPYCALSPVGVYTGSNGSTWDADTKKLRIFVPGTGAPQKYRTNSGNPTYYAGSAVMAAYNATDTDLQFEHLMTYYKLTIGDGSHGGNIKQIYVRQQGSTPEIAGVWEITYGDNISFEPITKTAIVSYSVEEAAGITQGTPVIIALPAYNFANGLILTVKDVNGDFQSYSIPASSTNFSTKRGSIITKTLPFEPKYGTINSATDWEAFAAVMNGSTTNDWDVYQWVGKDGTVKIGQDFSATSLTRITNFKYILDGNGKTITISNATAPLFERVSGTIKDLTLNGTMTSTAERVSAFAAYVDEGAKIYNCTNKMGITVNANDFTIAGGIVSTLEGGTVESCVNEGSISASVDCSSATQSSLQVGGIIGQIGEKTSILKNCTNKGDIEAIPVNSNVSGHAKGIKICGVGGIVGWLKKGNSSISFSVENCDNEGDVTLNGASIASPDGMYAYSSSVGGIVGIAGDISIEYGIFSSNIGANGLDATIKDCDNSGTVYNGGSNYSASDASNNKNYTGGVVGSLIGTSSKFASLDNCSNTGTLLTYDLTGNGTSQRPAFCQVVGGLIGYGGYVRIDGCTVNCVIGNGKRPATAISGGIGFAMRPFQFNNCIIWFSGYWTRIGNYNLNSSTIATVPLKYGTNNFLTPAPSITDSSVSDCQLGGRVYYYDLSNTDATSTADNTNNFDSSKSINYSGGSTGKSFSIVRGTGYNTADVTRTDVSFSGNSTLSSAPTP